MRRCSSKSSCSRFDRNMNERLDSASWQEVLDFWFLPATDPQHGKSRPEWFRKDPAFDAVIRERFGPLIEEALRGGLREWDQDRLGAVARIILLDQFTRNTFRDTPRAFSGDRLAQQ